MNINGLEFVNTCDACPEQYDVYDENHNMVGYVRLRWGGVSCKYPDVNGEVIYVASVSDDGWAGMFDSKEQRLHHLTSISNEIIKRIKVDRK